MISRLNGILLALEYYIRKPVDNIDSKFLFREIHKFQIFSSDDPYKMSSFRKFVEENVQKLVLQSY